MLQLSKYLHVREVLIVRNQSIVLRANQRQDSSLHQQYMSILYEYNTDIAYYKLRIELTHFKRPGGHFNTAIVKNASDFAEETAAADSFQ